MNKDPERFFFKQRRVVCSGLIPVFFVSLVAEPVDSKFILEAPPSAWRYPCTEREKLKCRVFQHFWEMGYYMTSGTKFGGDFLVYPGKRFGVTEIMRVLGERKKERRRKVGQMY